MPDLRMTALASLFVSGLAGCATVPKAEPVEFAKDADVAEGAATERQIEQALAALQADPSLHVALIGHADEDHSDEYNRELSRRRAEHLRARLLERDPGLAARIHVEARGEWDASNPGTDDDAKARNRRVELRFFHPRVCEPSFDADFLACEWSRLPEPAPVVAEPVASEPAPEPEPEPKPPRPQPPQFRGGYLYGLAGYAVSSNEFLRQHLRWGANGGYLWGWDSEFRIALGLGFDHLVDVGFLFPAPQACDPFCDRVERSHLRLAPELRIGGASRSVWAWIRLSAGMVLSHRERQLVELADGGAQVVAGERWFASGVIGIGPGIVVALTRHLFLTFEATVSYSPLRGLANGTGIYDLGAGLGWLF